MDDSGFFIGSTEGGNMADDIQKGTVETNEFDLMNPEEVEEAPEQPIQTEEDLAEPTPEPEKESEEDQPEEDVELRDVDNPKSYKHFQSLYNKTEKELREEREAKIRLEERLKALEEKASQPEQPKEEPKVEHPGQPPQKPADYNKYEAATDPDSASFKYREALEEYNQKLIQYQAERLERLNKTFEQEQQEKQQREKFAQQKAFALSEFQKAGADPEEAQKAFEWVASGQSGSWDNLLKYYRYVNSTPTTNKKEIIERRGQRKDEYVLPAGAVPSEPEPAENKDDFWGDLSKQRYF